MLKAKSIFLKKWTWYIHLIFNECYFGISIHILDLVVKYSKETCKVCTISRYTIEYTVEFLNIFEPTQLLLIAVNTIWFFI